MSKTIIFLQGLFFSFIFIAALPQITLAAEVSFKVVPSHSVGSPATLIEVRLDPDGKNINAIEGVLRLQKNEGVEISSVFAETGGSILTLWTQRPEYFEEEGVIRFSGGTPQGMSEDSLLFRIKIFTVKPGKASLTWINGAAYLNDNKGTLEAVSSRTINVSLAQSSPNQINSASIDSVPPVFDEVEMGKDDDMYEGNYFVSFNALDNLTGIDYYEVSEAGEVTKLKEGIYLLKDQTRKSRVVITAYDKAGNSQSTRLLVKYEAALYVSLFLLIGCLILVFFWRRARFLLVHLKR